MLRPTSIITKIEREERQITLTANMLKQHLLEHFGFTDKATYSAVVEYEELVEIRIFETLEEILP